MLSFALHLSPFLFLIYGSTATLLPSLHRPTHLSYLQHLFVGGVLAILPAQLLAEGLQLAAKLDHSLCGRLVAPTQLSGGAVIIWRGQESEGHGVPKLNMDYNTVGCCLLFVAVVVVVIVVVVAVVTVIFYYKYMPIMKYQTCGSPAIYLHLHINYYMLDIA